MAFALAFMRCIGKIELPICTTTAKGKKGDGLLTKLLILPVSEVTPMHGQGGSPVVAVPYC